ncbi:hypothetical protein [uncultured Nocardioides sp.]|uniref:hypothetical protein n=1 Tax=uncultured Nocardioides sp. TaxID=198441 RepID=UPI00260EC913|nr:hypothetical protein [uncultured Nocardioides sp.]
MSQQPPPPGSYGAQPPPGPYGGPPPGSPTPPARPRRRRPRAWWFALPLVMFVAAGTLLVTAFVSALGPLSQQDAVVPADGSAQGVELDDDGPRLLMAPEGQVPPSCQATDAQGEPVDVDAPTASYTYGNGSRSWSGFGVVDPGGDSLELTCSSSAPGATEVRVGPAPAGGAFAGFAVMLVAGIGLGFGGFAVLVLLVVLYASGAPRKPAAG